ncbi:MAG: type II toxin-antitoxin system HicB family antitoxin [Gallionellaceae bacterium]|nr:type II toxin-antitoxin system HicB family antitoxin [Gallionellaceae bacterium]
MERYEIILYWSAEDAAFIAEVPELPGCMAHGDSHEAALNNVKEAMSLWLEAARERGQAVPEAKGNRLMYA